MLNKFLREKFIFLMTLCGFFMSVPALAAGTLEKIAQTGSITLGFDISPPFAFTDTNGQPIGYTLDICAKLVDVIKKELKRPDITVKYKTLQASERVPSLLSGEIDLECGVLTNNAERRKKIAYTIGTFIAEVRLLVHKNSPIHGLSELVGKKVAVAKGTTSEPLLDSLNKRMSVGATPVVGANNQEAFAFFEEGKVDAFIIDDILLYSLRATSKNPQDMVITKTALSLEVIAIAMRKNDPAFKKLVDTEIFRLITQGEINALYKKWFESPIPPKQINLNYPMSNMLREALRSPTDWAPD